MTDPVKIIVGEGSITEVNVPEYNLIQTGGGGGGSGSDGATFFPEVSEEGVISWTNDGGYDNPEPVNIKGPAGNDGSDGEDGEDGVSPTVSFTTITGGHTMTVTDKDHPSGQSINIMDGSGGSASMTILSYGNSAWADFIAAYNSNSIVYCRASSAADPSSGSQTRLAFMAYVNDSTNPTSVEFQYYRSVSSHTDSQQGDQVFIYKLTSAGTWTVTVRDAFTKVVAGTNMTSSYSNGTLTLNATGGGSGGTSDYDALSNRPSINGNVLSGNKTAAQLGLAAASDIPSVPVQSVNSKTGTVVLSASDVGALPAGTAIPSKTSDLTNDSGFLTSAPVTSVNNKTGAVTLTASDVGAGTYSKPASGIPQTDLASAVQNKLDKTVVVSDTQPTAAENKLWVDTDAGAGSSYQVPTVAEMEAADAANAANISALQNRFPTTLYNDFNALENVYQPVIFRLNINSQHAPSAAAYMCIQYASSANYAVQLAFRTGATDIYMRAKASGTWGDWKSLTLS